MGIKQVETATVTGTITLGGNAEVVVTSARVTGSPLSVLVDVTLGDDAATVAGKMRSALALTAAISEVFAVSGSGADVVLTNHEALANDATLNMAIDNDTCTGLTTAATSTSTTAGTGITNGYCSLAELRANLQQTGSDTEWNDRLEEVITAVSRGIDATCHRRFFAASETRYYTSPDGIWLFIDDFSSITSLKTDEDADGVYETTWAATDYRKHPINAALDGEPYTMLSTTAFGSRYFPREDSAVEVTGLCGRSVVPDLAREACLIQSARIFKRKDAVFGVEGSNTFGTNTLMAELDIDVQDMLGPLVRQQ